MFVLTFANRVDNPEIPRDDESEKILFFQKKLEEWENKLIATLEEDLNIPNEISFKVPVVPAGVFRDRDLPGYPYWFSRLWGKAIHRMSKKSINFMLDYSRDRLSSVADANYSKHPEKQLEDQPIIVDYLTPLLAAICGVAGALIWNPLAGVGAATLCALGNIVANQ